jgi:hypothetical protein
MVTQDSIGVSHANVYSSPDGSQSCWDWWDWRTWQTIAACGHLADSIEIWVSCRVLAFFPKTPKAAKHPKSGQVAASRGKSRVIFLM